MSVKNWLLYWGRLLLIHFFAILAIWLAMYYPGLDTILAILYLTVVLLELTAMWRRGGRLRSGLLLLVVWQGPLVLCVAVFGSGSFTSANLLYWSFAQQLWLTPLLPLLAGFCSEVTTMGLAALAVYVVLLLLSYILRRSIKYSKVVNTE